MWSVSFIWNIDLYHYYLGREDQSVNEKVLMKRIDQQIRVTELVAECVDLNEVKKKYPKLASYMTRNISIMLSISSIHLLLIKTQRQSRKGVICGRESRLITLHSITGCDIRL